MREDYLNSEDNSSSKDKEFENWLLYEDDKNSIHNYFYRREFSLTL